MHSVYSRIFSPLPTEFHQEWLSTVAATSSLTLHGQILDNLMDNDLHQGRRDRLGARVRQLTVFLQQTHCHIKALSPRPLGNNNKWQEQITLGTKASTEP